MSDGLVDDPVISKFPVPLVMVIEGPEIVLPAPALATVISEVTVTFSPAATTWSAPAFTVSGFCSGFVLPGLLLEPFELPPLLHENKTEREHIKTSMRNIDRISKVYLLTSARRRQYLDLSERNK